jgi:hypothetical protein
MSASIRGGRSGAVVPWRACARRLRQITRPVRAGMVARIDARAAPASGAERRNANGTFDKSVLVAGDRHLEKRRHARRLGATGANRMARAPLAQERLDRAHGSRYQVADRLVVDLYPIDAFGVHALDTEALGAAHADHDAGLARTGIVAGIQDDEPLVARLPEQRGLGFLCLEAQRDLAARRQRRHRHEGVPRDVDQLRIAIPDAGERMPLFDHHRGDAPIGRIRHRHLAPAIAHLEEQVLVVGHALVQLALARDPEVLPLGRSACARTPIPMGWAARGSRDRAGDRADSGSPAGRWRPRECRARGCGGSGGRAASGSPGYRPVLQQVGGAGVAQRRGRDVVGDLGAPAGVVEHASDALACEGPAGGAGEEQGPGTPEAPVRLQHGVQMDGAVRAALAVLDADPHARAIDGGDTEVGHLGDAEATGVQRHA